MATTAPDVLASLRLEDGRRWGEAAVGWQWEDAKQILNQASPTPYSFLTRSRGGSKTADLAAVTISAMLAQAPPRSRLYGAASDRDQARLLIDSLAGFAARTPEIRSALRIDNFQATATRTGSTFEAIAADAASAWGLRPYLLVLDELAQWGETGGPKRLYEALTTAVAKVAGARMAILTTAGDPSHWSRKVLDHAKRDRLWRVHEVPGPPPWIDRERLEEQKRRLFPSSYARLFENRWVAGEDRLVDPEALRAAVRLDGPQDAVPNVRYAIGADLGSVHDRSVACVVHAEADAADTSAPPTLVLDRIAVWAGTRQSPVQLARVEEWVAQAARHYNNARVTVDVWQALGMIERMRSRGVRVEPFTFTAQSVGRIAVVLHQLLRERRLALPDDEALLDELANVRLRETSPNVFRLDHDPDKHDDRAVALGMAALQVVGKRVGPPPRASAITPIEPPLAEQVLGHAGLASGTSGLRYDDVL